jgi:hypothetical protein
VVRPSLTIASLSGYRARKPRPPLENSVGQLPMSSGWRVTYSGRIVDCRDESDAKALARELIKKGFRVSARTIEEVSSARHIEPIQMKEWLAE